MSGLLKKQNEKRTLHIEVFYRALAWKSMEKIKNTEYIFF